MKPLAALLLFIATLTTATAGLRLAVFVADATPPIGSPLCNGGVRPAAKIITPLQARGVVLLGAGDPIVLCAVDWVGIGNASNDRFREALAEAAGTTADRVTVHSLHQHDAPGSDFATEQLLEKHGFGGKFSNPQLDLSVIERTAAAAKASLANARPVTGLGLGAAKVDQFASNRRILDEEGKRVVFGRMSSSRKPEAAEHPEGTVDPLVRLVAFWDGDEPLAALTWYATHPMSYYGKGGVNWDTVGYAREMREKELGVPHVHFTGAGGNVAAGKYNNGAPERRSVLTRRLADGMERAWDSQEKRSLEPSDVSWSVQPVAMPVRDTLVEPALRERLADKEALARVRIRAARDLVFLRRVTGGHRIPLTCLRLGDARIVHMPGELFVEYQLAAQAMRPGDFVAMAAYGDYGPGYIGTEISYTQGGYEVGAVSRVAPRVESLLMEAMKKLLEIE